MFEFEIIKDELPESARVRTRVAVRAVIRYQGKILLVRTNQGDYKFPGGGVEEGESHTEALLREIREETGYVDIVIGACVGTAFEQNEEPLEPGIFLQMKSYYYICSLESERQTEGILDDYERELGFHEMFIGEEQAYRENEAMFRERKTHFGEKTDPLLPWLCRETMVLEWLCGRQIL